MKLFLLVLIAFVSSISTSPASPEEDEARARVLVKQLGSDDFRIRERAAKELPELGAGAKKALEEGCKSTDADVAERCRKLYPHAYECYLKQILNKLVTDPKSPLPDELPGIKRWLEVAGTSGDSKLNYLDMLSKHRELLVEVTSNPEKLDGKYQKFVNELSNRLVDPRLGIRRVPNQKESLSQSEMAMFLFMATDPKLTRDEAVGGQRANRQIYNLLQDKNWKTVLEAKYGRESFKRLFAEYLTQESNEDYLQQAMSIVLREELKEAAPSLLKIAGKFSLHPSKRTFALAAAGKLGGKEILPQLVSLFDDDTLVGTTEFSNQRRDVEIRDIALGMALIMTKQPLTDYGFDRDAPRDTDSTTMLANHYFTFPSEEARNKAMKKWNAFAAKEKLLPEAKK